MPSPTSATRSSATVSVRRSTPSSASALTPARPPTILGPVDAQKLCSSMTLFARADPHDPRFTSVLSRFYNGSPDGRTEELLDRAR